jgi:hypothetical protein
MPDPDFLRLHFQVAKILHASGYGHGSQTHDRSRRRSGLRLKSTQEEEEMLDQG